MSKNYNDKLKDPRWQKKRLDILNRDEFKCRSCEETTKTLHVHHLKYNDEPWEANDDDLVTLCEDCHTAATYIDAAYKYEIGYECISLVVRLMDTLEWASIEKCQKEREKRDAELGIKHKSIF